MTTPPATPVPAAEAEDDDDAQTDQGLKLKWFLPVGAGISIIALVAEIFTTRNPNPPIGQMGWAILAAAFVGFCGRHVYRVHQNLMRRLELESEPATEILRNERLLYGLIAVAALAIGVFFGSVY
jgi:hypothetical protein